jgi:23S rRNA (adenine1618-N6)-methyltransferase
MNELTELPEKKEHPKEKTGLHVRNKHRARYDFKALIERCPELGQHVKPNDFGDDSIDFFVPEAVMELNRALLMHYYNLEFWEIPKGYLCPPIPGRADYVHHAADLLKGPAGSLIQTIPKGAQIKCLDIGVGANCVYPIVGIKEYGWSFIATDIDSVALDSARNIVSKNLSLEGKIDFRLQANPADIFKGVITKTDRIDLSICNPPFHASAEEAQTVAIRKISNLKQKKITKPILNFGGTSAELWCEGGEEQFVNTMIEQSRNFSQNCFWFSTLVSKQASLKKVQNALKLAGASEIVTVPMSHGNKSSRMVAWTFLTPQQQKAWRDGIWKSQSQ